MKLAVVGAGAWGLPAAAESARRGHHVTLFDQHGPANPLGSSGGASRIWRLAHPDRPRVRMARAAVASWRRLEELSGQPILLQTGILWRDRTGAAGVAASLAAEGVEHRWVEPAEVADVLPGCRDNGAPAVFQPDAGTVLADVALRAQLRSFEDAGGRHVRARVHGIDVGHQVRLDYAPVPSPSPGPPESELFDSVVLAPGPWASQLLGWVGIDVPLVPSLQQVTYLAAPPGWERLPCIFEAGDTATSGLYGMPEPGRGYKIGLDRALRAFEEGDTDRTPDPAVTAEIARRAGECFGWPAQPLGSQVCCWTTSPDGRFIVDRVAGGRVVLACGDSGEGFKFSALMGEILTDLAEGADPPEYAAGFSLARLSELGPAGPPPPLGH